MNDFLDAFTFIGDNASLLFDDARPARSGSPARRSAISLVDRRAARRLARPHPPRLVRRHQHLQRRPRAAQPRRDRDRDRPARARLVNVMLALVVLAVPPILTNAYVAVDGVDRDLVDAARGMGMTRAQILLQHRAAARAAADVRRHPHRGRLRRRDGARSRARRRRGGLGDIIVNQASYRLAGVMPRRSASPSWRSWSTRLRRPAARASTPRGWWQGHRSRPRPRPARGNQTGDRTAT